MLLFYHCVMDESSNEMSLSSFDDAAVSGTAPSPAASMAAGAAAETPGIHATSSTVKRRRRLNREEQAILEGLFAEVRPSFGILRTMF